MFYKAVAFTKVMFEKGTIPKIYTVKSYQTLLFNTQRYKMKLKYKITITISLSDFIQFQHYI